MPFTLTDNPKFYDLEMSLSNNLMISLFCSNDRMVIFSKTEKNNSYHSKHSRDDTLMRSTWHGKWMGEVLKFATCLQILLILR